MPTEGQGLLRSALPERAVGWKRGHLTPVSILPSSHPLVLRAKGPSGQAWSQAATQTASPARLSRLLGCVGLGPTGCIAHGRFSPGATVLWPPCSPPAPLGSRWTLLKAEKVMCSCLWALLRVHSFWGQPSLLRHQAGPGPGSPRSEPANPDPPHPPPSPPSNSTRNSLGSPYSHPGPSLCCTRDPGPPWAGPGRLLTSQRTVGSWGWGTDGGPQTAPPGSDHGASRCGAPGPWGRPSGRRRRALDPGSGAQASPLAGATGQTLPTPACPCLGSLLQTGEGGSWPCAALCTKLAPHPAALLARSWALGRRGWPSRQPSGQAASHPARPRGQLRRDPTTGLREAAAASPACAYAGRAACRNCSPSLRAAGGAEQGGAGLWAYISQSASGIGAG